MAVARLSMAQHARSQDRAQQLQFWMKSLLWITGILMLAGLSCIYSTTVFLRIALGRPPYADFFQHLMFLGLAVAAALGTIAAINIYVPARRWLRWAIPIAFFVSLCFVALVQLPGLGVEAFGSRRFLNLGPVTFQPSELLKISLVLYLCQTLCWWRRYPTREEAASRRKTAVLGKAPRPGLWAWLSPVREERPWWPDLPKRCMLVITLAVGLTVIQPDLGTAILILGASVITLALAGTDWRHVAIFFLLLGSLGTAAIGVDQDKYDYAMERVHTWMNPLADDNAAGYQITQARGALAVGGIFGRGYLESQQKINRLPLSTKDFVYPIMVEELGYIGGVAIIAAFLALAFIGMKLAQSCRDPFNRTAIAALGFALCLQAFVNIAVSIGTLPLSGLTLPFFSEGGTSVVVSTVSIGIMLGLALTELKLLRRQKLAQQNSAAAG